MPEKIQIVSEKCVTINVNSGRTKDGIHITGGVLTVTPTKQKPVINASLANLVRATIKLNNQHIDPEIIPEINFSFKKAGDNYFSIFIQ